MVDLEFDTLGGILPVITQDYKSGEVLMLAFMNREAWEITKKTGYAHYWSRSRQKLWKKGELSGNLQEVREVRVNCENNCILVRVRQIGGAACHTGYRSCFFRVMKGEELEIQGEKVFDPEVKYGGRG